jgi:hypothetical protein
MEKRLLTADELRKLAEAVDGIRDRSAYLVWTASGEPQAKTSLDPDDELIVECETRNAAPERQSFRSIMLDPPMLDEKGNPVTDLPAKYDAMFWSEAAVEKFVLPYYARLNKPSVVTAMLQAFNHPSVCAVIHPPLSYIRFVTSIRTGDRGFEALDLREFESLQGIARRSAT